MRNTQESEGTMSSDLIPIEESDIDGEPINALRWRRKSGGALEITYYRPGDVGPISSFSKVLYDAGEQAEFWAWLARVRR
jgi:hypothetical protein